MKVQAEGLHRIWQARLTAIRQQWFEKGKFFKGKTAQSWKGSTTIESAIILPLCFLIVFILIQAGIMYFDQYSFSMVSQNWARKQITAGHKEWKNGLQEVLNRNMIYASELEVIKENESEVYLSMDYKTLWLINPFTSRRLTVKLTLPKEHKQKLYHFLNGKQLISRIPYLDQIQEKYFELLRKIKKD